MEPTQRHRKTKCEGHNSTLLAPLRVSSNSDVLATNVNDKGPSMRKGVASTCEEAFKKKKSDDGQGEQRWKALQHVGVK